MRDYSHGKEWKEKTRDFSSFKLRVGFQIKKITGWQDGAAQFSDADIRKQMNAGLMALDAAVALLLSTDYACDEPESAEHGRESWIYEKAGRA